MRKRNRFIFVIQFKNTTFTWLWCIHRLCNIGTFFEIDHNTFCAVLEYCSGKYPDAVLEVKLLLCWERWNKNVENMDDIQWWEIWMKLDKTRKQKQSIFFIKMTLWVIYFKHVFLSNQDALWEIERGFYSKHVHLQ